MATRRSGGSSARGGSSSSTGKRGTGCLIWLFFLLATLLLFVFNWDRIRQTIEATRFSEALSTERDTGGTEGQDGSARPEPTPEPSPGPSAPAPAGATPATAMETPAPAVETPAPAVETPAPAGTTPAPAGTTPAPSTTGKPVTVPVSPVEQVARTRIAALYFVRVDDDGTIRRQEVKRTVDASDSPMTDALNALLAGPTVDELNRKLVSLIPSGTRLNDARVSGSTAYLDFSEAFMFNNYGIEGYAGQLTQIIYTATSFPNVKDIQILIDGQKREYLAGDGIYIGKPLSRASF